MQFCSILFVVATVIASAVSQTRLEQVDIYVSVDDDRKCDMTLGQIHLKVCGTNCCHRNSIGTTYQEGGIYTFSGPAALGECNNFDLGLINPAEINMGLYHSGTDAICIEKIRAFATDGSFFECSFNNTMIDNNEYIISKDCDALQLLEIYV